MKPYFFTLLIAALAMLFSQNACNRGSSEQQEHHRVEAPWKAPKDKAMAVKNQVEQNNQIVADQLDDDSGADDDDDNGEDEDGGE